MFRLQGKTGGVTLTETIIVLLIIAILATLAVPPFLSYLRDNRLKSASEQLHSNLNLARSEALKQNIAITVVFQTGASWCYGLTTAATCNCQAGGNCNLGQVDATLYPDTSLSLTTIAASTVFSAARGTPSSSGSITFTSGTKSITIELNSLGFTKICSSTVSGYSSC